MAALVLIWKATSASVRSRDDEAGLVAVAARGESCWAVEELRGQRARDGPQTSILTSSEYVWMSSR